MTRQSELMDLLSMDSWSRRLQGVDPRDHSAQPSPPSQFSIEYVSRLEAKMDLLFVEIQEIRRLISAADQPVPEEGDV